MGTLPRSSQGSRSKRRNLSERVRRCCCLCGGHDYSLSSAIALSTAERAAFRLSIALLIHSDDGGPLIFEDWRRSLLFICSISPASSRSRNLFRSLTKDISPTSSLQAARASPHSPAPATNRGYRGVSNNNHFANRDASNSARQSGLTSVVASSALHSRHRFASARLNDLQCGQTVTEIPSESSDPLSNLPSNLRFLIRCAITSPVSQTTRPTINHTMIPSDACSRATKEPQSRYRCLA